MYIDLVLCKHENGGKYLFKAPAWTHLKKDDSVIVETKYGDQMAKVINSFTVNTDRAKDVSFIVDCCNATLPLKKVLGRLEYIEFRYLEDSENDNV